MAALLLHVDHAGTTNVLAFDATPIRIGRDTNNECRLEFSSISRTHATIDLREGRLMLRDEHSRQGTWAKDRATRLRPGRWEDLEALGFAFRIGSLGVRVERCDPEAEPVATLQAAAPARAAGAVAKPATLQGPPRASARDEGRETVLALLDPESIERAVQGTEGWTRDPARALWTEFVRRYARCRERDADADPHREPR